MTFLIEYRIMYAMKIYKPSIKFFYNGDLSLLKKGEIIEINENDSMQCSTKEIALNLIKNELLELTEDQIIVNISITELELDNPDYWERYFYDQQLNYLGKFDYESICLNPKYASEEWILFVYNNQVTCGLIVEQAKDNEPYLVIYENNSLNDSFPHCHLDELFIIDRISEDYAKELLPAKFFEMIKLRKKAYYN